MTYFLLVLILILAIINAYFAWKKLEINMDVIVNKDAVARLDVTGVIPRNASMSVKEPDLEDYSFLAAVKEERRQLAFERFCLNYNEEYDMFCSKPAGHGFDEYVKGDQERTQPRHGYAGIFWD